MSDSARISPTAHYTGYVWQKHGLAHPALATRRGAAFFWSLEPAMRALAPMLGGLTLERMLLRRHLAIDAVLDRWIADGTVTAVVELAAGMSGRGLRFAERWAERGLVYIDTDLPAMVAMRRARLADVSRPAGHHIKVVDALAASGPQSLGAVLGEVLTPDAGVAVVSEGLLNYFHKRDVEALWARVSEALTPYREGRYVAELHVRDEVSELATARAFMAGLSVFVRGATHLHYADADEAARAALDSGFGAVELPPPGQFVSADAVPGWRRADVMRLVTASVAAPSSASPA